MIVNQSPAVGSTVVCAETGRSFVVARDGCSFNYAQTSAGEIVSDEGVDIRERRELLDRSRPFTAYISSDGRRLTGWKGNVLGVVVASSSFRSGFWGSYVHAYTIRDVHGAHWHGRNAGNGMCITVRPSKGERHAK